MRNHVKEIIRVLSWIYRKQQRAKDQNDLVVIKG